MSAYTLLVLLVAMERLSELNVARRNAAWSFARGGTEYGGGHYPVMVLLHTGLLAGCLAEVHLAGRPFDLAFIYMLGRRFRIVSSARRDLRGADDSE